MKNSLFCLFLPILVFFTIPIPLLGLHHAKNMSLVAVTNKKLFMHQNAQKAVAVAKIKLNLGAIEVAIHEADGKKYAMGNCAVARVMRGKLTKKSSLVAGPSGCNFQTFEPPQEYTIILDPHVFYKMSPQAQAFFIGHEMGHIAQNYFTRLALQRFLLEDNKMVAEAAVKENIDPASNSQHQLECDKEFYKLSRALELEADEISATQLNSLDIGIAAMQELIEFYKPAPKVHPYLQYCEDLFLSHPHLNHRLQHLIALKGEAEFIFDGQKDDFTQEQQKFIERLYRARAAGVGLMLENDEEQELYESLPKEVQDQLYKDCVFKAESKTAESKTERKTEGAS